MKYLEENLFHKIKNGTKFLISDWFAVVDSEFADKFFSPLFSLNFMAFFSSCFYVGKAVGGGSNTTWGWGE
jgi:hypothetical protein